MSTKRNAKGHGYYPPAAGRTLGGALYSWPRPGDRKQIQKSLYGKSRKGATKAAANNDHNRRRLLQPSYRMTLGGMAGYLAGQIAGGLKTLTMTTYEGQIRTG